MMELVYEELGEYRAHEVMPLYEAAGWINYTQKPEMLRLACENSLVCIACRDNGKLVGLLRAVGDGHSIIYVQDILVLPEYRRRGIGAELLVQLTRRYPNTYQTVLLTDNTEKTVAFYKALGFFSADKMGCVAFCKFNA